MRNTVNKKIISYFFLMVLSISFFNLFVFVKPAYAIVPSNFPYNNLTTEAYDYMGAMMVENGIVFETEAGLQAAVNKIYADMSMVEKNEMAVQAGLYASGAEVWGTGSIMPVLASFYVGWQIGNGILWAWDYFDPPSTAYFAFTHNSGSYPFGIPRYPNGVVYPDTVMDLSQGSASKPLLDWYISQSLFHDITYNSDNYQVMNITTNYHVQLYNSSTYNDITFGQNTNTGNLLLLTHSYSENWRVQYDFGRVITPENGVQQGTIDSQNNLHTTTPNQNFVDGSTSIIKPTTYLTPVTASEETPHPIVGKDWQQVQVDSLINPPVAPGSTSSDQQISLLTSILNALNPLSWLQLIYNETVSIYNKLDFTSIVIALNPLSWLEQIYNEAVSIYNAVITNTSTIVNTLLNLPQAIATEIETILKTLFQPQTDLTILFTNLQIAITNKMGFVDQLPGVFVGTANSSMPVWKFPVRPPIYNKYITIDFNNYANWWVWERSFLAIIIWFGCLAFILKMLRWPVGTLGSIDHSNDK